ALSFFYFLLYDALHFHFAGNLFGMAFRSIILVQLIAFDKVYEQLRITRIGRISGLLESISPPSIVVCTKRKQLFIALAKQKLRVIFKRIFRMIVNTEAVVRIVI